MEILENPVHPHTQSLVAASTIFDQRHKPLVEVTDG
jgi:ABC-type oligopeptide transport system ATPase subunit